MRKLSWFQTVAATVSKAAIVKATDSPDTVEERYAVRPDGPKVGHGFSVEHKCLMKTEVSIRQGRMVPLKRLCTPPVKPLSVCN